MRTGKAEWDRQTRTSRTGQAEEEQEKQNGIGRKGMQKRKGRLG
jgi:hypothetical protein